MKIPLKLDFQDVEPTEALREKLDRQVARLERLCDDIVRCEISLSVPHRHSRQGNELRVKIRATRPHTEINVSHEGPRGGGYAVVRETFDIACRQLDEQLRISHGNVKRHAVTPPEPLP